MTEKTVKTLPTQSLTPQEHVLEPVHLVAVSGPGKGAKATLAEGTLVVGSSSSFAEEVAGLRVELSRHTIAALQSHLWPGNARELKNAVTRCLALGRFDTEAKAGHQPEASAACRLHRRERGLQAQREPSSTAPASVRSLDLLPLSRDAQRIQAVTSLSSKSLRPCAK